MGKALALGFMLIYLVMVAQFQSLLSPFIVIFTVPLAFTGGMIGLGFFGMSISAMALSVMVFSQDAGNAMQKGMAVVVAFGLLYATLMTLFIVPVMYDILYRKQPKVIDVEDSDL